MSNVFRYWVMIVITLFHMKYGSVYISFDVNWKCRWIVYTKFMYFNIYYNIWRNTRQKGYFNVCTSVLLCYYIFFTYDVLFEVMMKFEHIQVRNTVSILLADSICWNLHKGLWWNVYKPESNCKMINIYSIFHRVKKEMVTNALFFW